MGNLGILRHLMWLTGTARVRWCEGSPLLLAPLAAAVAGGGSLLSAGFIIWTMSGWVRLVTQDPHHFASECRRVINQFLRFRQWPVKNNGNEHFATIFLDYSWTAGLYLGEDCHCLVFIQSVFPFLQSSLR